MFPVDKVVSTNILVNPATATSEKNKKKENNLKKIKQKRKRSAREKIYLGQFQEDLNFLEDFVEFQKLCQHQTKTPYTVRKYLKKIFVNVCWPDTSEEFGPQYRQLSGDPAKSSSDVNLFFPS